MLLQCEMEFGVAEPALAWLRSGTLESLTELNEACLALLAEQARAVPGSVLLAEIARGYPALDAPGRRRAAGCLYLLLDAGFADPQRWRPCGDRPVGDGSGGGSAPFFTVGAAAEVAQSVFTFAWHVARCQSTAACLLLGAPAACVALLARHTLGQVRALALAHPQWLKPRWAGHPDAWRALLRAAASAEPAALERARLRGQALLAAEARQPANTGHRPRLPPRLSERARYPGAGRALAQAPMRPGR